VKKYIEGPIECAGVVDDNNVPAFQAGTAELSTGGTVTVTGVYLTEKSWIGITRLSLTGGGNDGELKVTQPTSSTQVDGYGNAFEIASTDADDRSLISWVIVTGLKGMETCLPVAIT